MPKTEYSNTLTPRTEASTRATQYYRPLLALLTAMYLAGFIGLQVSVLRPFFMPLVPFNLITTAGLLFLFQTSWSPSFLAFCVFTFLAGYGVEVAGVHTGLIFGRYAYGEALGYQLWRVPLLIGLNWLVLVYGAGVISTYVRANSWVRAALGAALMVALDRLIEPVASGLDFWYWLDGYIPLQNYVAWFVVSFALLLVFNKLPFRKENRLAVPLYLAQGVFFLLHNLVALFR